MDRRESEGQRVGAGSDGDSRHDDGGPDDEPNTDELRWDGGRGPMDGNRGRPDSQGRREAARSQHENAHTQQGGSGPQESGRPRQGGQSKQSRQRGQDGHGHSPGNRPRARQGGGGGGGFSRRQMLVGGGAALAVGGWYLFLREGPGPEETVESFYDALDQNDYERANQLLHEHRRRERGRINPVNVREYGFSVQRTTIVGDDPGIRPGRFDGVQTFEVIEAEVVISSGRESISSTENVVVAQTPEGNWKIWSTSTTI